MFKPDTHEIYDTVSDILETAKRIGPAGDSDRASLLQISDGMKRVVDWVNVFPDLKENRFIKPLALAVKGLKDVTDGRRVCGAVQDVKLPRAPRVSNKPSIHEIYNLASAITHEARTWHPYNTFSLEREERGLQEMLGLVQELVDMVEEYPDLKKNRYIKPIIEALKPLSSLDSASGVRKAVAEVFLSKAPRSTPVEKGVLIDNPFNEDKPNTKNPFMSLAA